MKKFDRKLSLQMDREDQILDLARQHKGKGTWQAYETFKDCLQVQGLWNDKTARELAKILGV